MSEQDLRTANSRYWLCRHKLVVIFKYYWDYVHSPMFNFLTVSFYSPISSLAYLFCCKLHLTD